MRIVLDDEDFRTLISGGVVTCPTRLVGKSYAGEVVPTNDVEIILSEIGFNRMLDLLHETIRDKIDECQGKGNTS